MQACKKKESKVAVVAQRVGRRAPHLQSALSPLGQLLLYQLHLLLAREGHKVKDLIDPSQAVSVDGRLEETEVSNRPRNSSRWKCFFKMGRITSFLNSLDSWKVSAVCKPSQSLSPSPWHYPIACPHTF